MIKFNVLLLAISALMAQSPATTFVPVRFSSDAYKNPVRGEYGSVDDINRYGSPYNGPYGGRYGVGANPFVAVGANGVYTGPTGLAINALNGFNSFGGIGSKFGVIRNDIANEYYGGYYNNGFYNGPFTTGQILNSATLNNVFSA